jgi:hypothetical protein
LRASVRVADGLEGALHCSRADRIALSRGVGRSDSDVYLSPSIWGIISGFCPRVFMKGWDARLGDLREIEIESKTMDFPTCLTSLSEAGGEALVLVNPGLDDTGKWATWTTG